LEAKQTAECQKAFSEIKKVLYSSAVLSGVPGGGGKSLNISLKKGGTGPSPGSRVGKEEQYPSRAAPSSPPFSKANPPPPQEAGGGRESPYDYADEVAADEGDGQRGGTRSSDFAQMQMDDAKYLRQPPNSFGGGGPSSAFKDLVYSGEDEGGYAGVGEDDEDGNYYGDGGDD
jgi:hypothetical protein